MNQPQERYIPALGYRWLTPLYDDVVRVTTREATFKRALLTQAQRAEVSIHFDQALSDAGYRNLTLQDVRGMLKPIYNPHRGRCRPAYLRLCVCQSGGTGVVDWRHSMRTYP